MIISGLYVSCNNYLTRYSERNTIKIFTLNKLRYTKTTKNQLNQRPCHNLQLHQAYRHVKMCVLLRHTICESFKVSRRYNVPSSNVIHFCDFDFKAKTSISDAQKKTEPKIKNPATLGSFPAKILIFRIFSGPLQWPVARVPLTDGGRHRRRRRTDIS